MRLTKAILPSLMGTSYKVPLSVPSYDPSELSGGILHVGVGNFHRGHMASYLDDLLNKDFDNNKMWGIVGSGIGKYGKGKRTWLKEQDWMQTLVERDGETVEAKVLAGMVDFVPAGDEEKQRIALKHTLTDDDKIKIVSLCITEGGYFLSDEAFDPTHPLMEHDIKNPDEPKSIFGMLVYALKYRKDNDMVPFTVLSTDNIPHNGDVVRSVVVGLANEIDTDLGKWIDENASFPNNMVDRIVPATTDEMRDFVEETFKYRDEYPICCEPFRQWVLEDKFCQGRPPLECLDGIKFVEDVTPYEFMKIRILNGGHASLCYPSALLDVDYVHESTEHPTIGPFVDALERNEIIPTVPPVPDTDLLEYWELIAKRFSNPTIMDTIVRNCFDGTSRQPKFIIPVIADNLKAGRNIDGLALVCAMWCRYVQGKTESGKEIPPNDPQWDRLQDIAKQASADPSKWLAMKDVYGELGEDPTLINSFALALKTIEEVGVEAAMKKYIQQGTLDDTKENESPVAKVAA